MIEVYTLFSGSTGNSYYVKEGKTQVLIDAGRSRLCIEKSLNALGTSLSQIDGIFVTHEHADHTSSLEMISKKHQIPIYITRPSFEAMANRGTYFERLAKPQDVHFDISIGSLSLRSFPVPHDSRQNVGYVISSSDCTFGVATDIGHLTEEIGESLSLCQKIIVESNHDINMVKNGPYPQFLKDRVLSANGHLSNDKCAEFVAYLCDKGVKEVTLAHLSRENNLPELAYETTKSHLINCGFEHIPVKIAFSDITVCATNGKSYSIKT